MSNSLELLKARLADVDALHAAVGIMDWDQQTYMPSGGATARAEHVSLLSGMHHSLFTREEVGEWIEDAKASASGDDALMLKRVKRDYTLSTKLPESFVTAKTKLAALAHEEWVAARANNDFQSFQTTLERMFEFARQEAEFLGYKDHIYDALLDQYEEGGTQKDAAQMFATLKGPMTELIKEIAATQEIDDSRLIGTWDERRQSSFTESLVTAVGFDMTRGRQDTAPHPFCTGWSVGDTRLTTRFKPYIGSAIFGSLHEAGHGMYEQGSPLKWDRTPLCGGVSLGIHESQSRTWENIVGRSLGFWQFFLPKLQETFPELAGLSPAEFYRLINKVQPSFIRVEADEVTYNMHVMIRFELECDLLSGQLAIKNLPEAWNAKYKEYLGIIPRNDSEGCLQDVHWSQGSIGYFPTYSMGNLLSYQFWNTMAKDVPNQDALIGEGKFKPILSWLQEKIYSKGRSISPKELVMQVTGKPIGADDYIAGISAKYRDIYQLPS